MLVSKGHVSIQRRKRNGHWGGVYVWSGEHQGFLPPDALASGWRDGRAPWLLWQSHRGVESYWRESFRNGLRLIWGAWATQAGMRAWLRSEASREIRNELMASRAEWFRAEAEKAHAEAAEKAQAEAAAFRAWWFSWQ